MLEQKGLSAVKWPDLIMDVCSLLNADEKFVEKLKDKFKEYYA